MSMTTSKSNKKPLKQSETKKILRSQIKLNPINPKRHSDSVIKLQRKNLQNVGYLGGIVWNERSGNVVDGHRRIYAMDAYYGYTGEEDADYEVKVEAVDLDEKTEKEQLTYMAVGNTQADVDLIAKYISEIDYTDIGLSDKEMQDIFSMAQLNVAPSVETLDLFDTREEPSSVREEHTEASYREGKERMKQVKAETEEKARQDQMDESAFVTLSFSDFNAKAAFCELVGISINDRYMKGETLLDILE